MTTIVDENWLAGLNKPNHVPNCQFLRINWKHPAISQRWRSDWSDFIAQKRCAYINRQYGAEYRWNNYQPLVPTAAPFVACPCGIAPNGGGGGTAGWYENAALLSGNLPIYPTFAVVCYVEAYSGVADTLIVGSGGANNDTLTSGAYIDTSGNLKLAYNSGITWTGGAVPIRQPFSLVVGTKSDKTLFAYMNGIDLGASSSAVTATYNQCLKRITNASPSVRSVFVPLAVMVSQFNDDLNSLRELSVDVTQLLTTA